ncbi:MAG: hypothetical protein GY832_38355 [Chloroflexi bacterium]|nr:hypothetical protein [Chloroflexota bacterium]
MFTHYDIRVEGHLGPSASAWFPGLAINHEANGDTTISGPVVDQAALYGILIRIRDLGLTLVSVQRLTGAQS